MKVFDRLLNKTTTISKIEVPVVLGRYLFIESDADTLMNYQPINSSTFLVPYNEQLARIFYNNHELSFSFKKNPLLSLADISLIKHTLNEISTELEIIENINEIDQINPLLRNFDERLDITDFERFVHKHLSHMQEICRDPAYHLNRETVKVNVARAKRIPVKAIGHLAAHTEDWSRRRIRSVEPRKILTEVFDYDIIIYENRVTATLIRELLNRFNQRIENEINNIDEILDKVQELIDSKKNIGSKEKIYWYKKVDRDFNKLGNAIQDNSKNKIKINEVKKFLHGVFLRLAKMQDSFVYRSNITKPISKERLDRTNLFDNHQHYRYVKILWDETLSNEKYSPEEISNGNQMTVKAYVDFAWVIIIRSLIQVGFKEVRHNQSGTHRLKSDNYPLISIQAQINSRLNIELKIGDSKLVFVPIPTYEEIVFANKDLEGRFLLTLSGKSNSNNVIKVSPVDLSSEERISGILFKLILKKHLEQYLYKLDSIIISQFNILKEWFTAQNKYVSNIGKRGKLDLYLKRKFNDARLKELDDQLEKQRLSPRANIRKEQITNLKSIRASISESLNHFSIFSTCISCGVQNEKNLDADFQGGIKYSCNNRGCEAQYGYVIINDMKQVFYEVHDSEIIRKNLHNKGLLDELNYFGYENILPTI